MLSKAPIFLLFFITGCTYLKDPIEIIDNVKKEASESPFSGATISFDISTHHITIKANSIQSFDSIVYLSEVVYVSLLPVYLESYHPKYLGDTMIENEIFYKVETTYLPQLLNKHIKNKFQYWINRKSFNIGYFAFSLNDSLETIHFCKTINPRKVSSHQFYDFVDHQPLDKKATLDDLELLFTKGDLKERGKIALINIKVN